MLSSSLDAVLDKISPKIIRLWLHKPVYDSLLINGLQIGDSIAEFHVQEIYSASWYSVESRIPQTAQFFQIDVETSKKFRIFIY